jgi:hypothetical protein
MLHGPVYERKSRDVRAERPITSPLPRKRSPQSLVESAQAAQAQANPSLATAARAVEAVTGCRSEPAAGFNFGKIRVFDSPRKLPQPMLNWMERSFGESFAEVRIHEDLGASAAGAFAAAKGSDLYFAPGHYRPGTPAGDALIGHELTHVVQQRRGRVAGWFGVQALARKPLLECEARQQGYLAARGDRVFVGGRAPYGSIQCDDPKSQGGKQPSTTPRSAPAPTPLKYDFRTHRLSPLATGTTLAEINLQLKKKIDAGEIKSASATGVTPGSTEEIFVLYALWNLAEQTRWGTEADLVTAIGWPAKAGDPEPQGRVTIRIDSQGAASAELVAAGPVPKPPQTTVAAGSAKLKSDYKLPSVRDDGKAKWVDAEIGDVLAALALLPPADRAALQGVELIRVQTLPENASGAFSAGGGVAKEATTVTELPSLKLSDRAFSPATAFRFVGGKGNTLPATFHTILHEVGHAVEKAVFRPADAAYDQAIIESHKKGTALNQSAAAYKKASTDYTALYKQYEAAKKAGDATLENSLSQQLLTLNKTMDALSKTNQAQNLEYQKALGEEKSREAAVAKTRVPATVVAPFKADASAKKTAVDSALNAAKTTLKSMSAPDVTSASYMKSVEATATAIATFATEAASMSGGTGKLETAVSAQVAVRKSARDALSVASPSHVALTTLAPVETAQDVWLEAEMALAGAQRRTLRLQKFVDLITTNKIDPFTEYSKENWRLRPEEFYAEAYGLWLTDPEYLMTNYKVVYHFFQSGDYRK